MQPNAITLSLPDEFTDFQSQQIRAIVAEELAAHRDELARMFTALVAELRDATPFRALNITSAAEALDVSTPTIRTAIAHGHLPARRWGTMTRISNRDLEAFYRSLPAATTLADTDDEAAA